MSPFNENGKVWMNGRMVDWKDAHIHIASHAVHYGSSIFEGFRAYRNPEGTAILCLQAHIHRLFNSCKIYRMDIPYTEEDLCQAVIDTVKANALESGYIRPLVYRGYHSLGVNPFPNPVDCAILAWEWGQYLGEEALEKGVDVKISTWQRMAPNTFPALAKAGANYMNSQLIKMEATLEGYVEGIALNVGGHVSEGSGENLFLIVDGVLHTPPISSSVLLGITRKCIMTIAGELDIPVVEDVVPREMLYIADEVFFSGSAAEITPIRSVDKIAVGNGRRGPITKKIQDEFFGILMAKKKDRHHWLTYI